MDITSLKDNQKIHNFKKHISIIIKNRNKKGLTFETQKEGILQFAEIFLCKIAKPFNKTFSGLNCTASRVQNIFCMKS